MVSANSLQNKVALVTGAAKRLGDASARALHNTGANVVVHYHKSKAPAERLVDDLNQQRPDSAIAISTHLGNKDQGAK